MKGGHREGVLRCGCRGAEGGAAEGVGVLSGEGHGAGEGQSRRRLIGPLCGEPGQSLHHTPVCLRASHPCEAALATRAAWNARAVGLQYSMFLMLIAVARAEAGLTREAARGVGASSRGRCHA